MSVLVRKLLKCSGVFLLYVNTLINFLPHKFDEVVGMLKDVGLAMNTTLCFLLSYDY